MKVQQHISSVRKNSEAGFTLSEIMIAVTMVSVILLAASVLFLNTTITMNKAFNNAQMISERSNVLATLERQIRSGNDASVLNPGIGCGTQDVYTPSDCYALYRLIVNLPGDTSPKYVYRLWSSNANPQKFTLDIALEENGVVGNYKNITYMQTIQQPDPNAPNPIPVPFEYISLNKEVILKFNFAGLSAFYQSTEQPQIIQTVKAIRLEGGAGV